MWVGADDIVAVRIAASRQWGNGRREEERRKTKELRTMARSAALGGELESREVDCRRVTVAVTRRDRQGREIDERYTE